MSGRRGGFPLSAFRIPLSAFQIPLSAFRFPNFHSPFPTGTTRNPCGTARAGFGENSKKPSGNSRVFSSAHPANASSPISSTEPGTANADRRVHP